MSTPRFRMIPASVALCAAAFFFFDACSEKPSPPVFSLYGYRKMIVIPFGNASHDPELAKETQDAVTGAIVGLGALPVIEAAQVDAFIHRSRINRTAGGVNDPEARKKLAAEFGCDLILTGSADGYAESLKDRQPERVVVNDSTGEAKWGFYTDREVSVDATAKLFDASSGALLWTRKSGGGGENHTWNPLPIPGRLRVPEQLRALIDLSSLVKYRARGQDDDEIAMSENTPNSLLYLKSRTFSGLRRNALNQTVNGLVSDFRPRGGWKPAPKAGEVPPAK